jgi:hypothetical protein
MRFPLPSVHSLAKVSTATTTALLVADQKSSPAFLVHDPLLPNRMLKALKAYLETSPQRLEKPSVDLVSSIQNLHSVMNLQLGLFLNKSSSRYRLQFRS